MKKLVIIGVLGDLAQKRLLPVSLKIKEKIPLRIIGVDLLEEIPTALKNGVDQYIQSNGRVPLDVVETLKPGDVVYLATPPDYHLLQLFEILCSGSSAVVAVEKPLCWLRDHALSVRACEVLEKYANAVVYVDHYTWIENFHKQILSGNALAFDRVRHIDMALIDNPDEAPPHRLYTLQDGMIGDCVSHHYALLMKWLRHQQIGDYQLEVQEVMAASYLQNGVPLPIKGEMAVRIRSKLFANGQTIDLTFRAGKGTGKIEKSATFASDHGTLAACKLDTRDVYFHILVSLLKGQSELEKLRSVVAEKEARQKDMRAQFDRQTEQMNHLKQLLGEKDSFLSQLQDNQARLQQTLDDILSSRREADERSDTIIMSLTQQVKQQQVLIEDLREHPVSLWQRFKRRMGVSNPPVALNPDEIGAEEMS